MKHYQDHSEFILLNMKLLPPQKPPKSHVRLITYTNNDNGFDLLIAVVFAMIPQLGRLGPKHQDLVIPFSLGSEENS